MGKTGGRQSKALISIEKLCDEDFDKLVIDTSIKIAQRGAEDGPVARHEESLWPKLNPSDNLRPVQPKRPMNAFMVWGQAVRRELHQRFSNVQNAPLSKALGRVWRSLNPTEKEPYMKRANLIKANHKRDYPNYRYQPRRVQERRPKSSMLIGITLNHPVSQVNHQEHQYLCQQPGTARDQSFLYPGQKYDKEPAPFKHMADGTQMYQPYSMDLPVSNQDEEFSYPPGSQFIYNVDHCDSHQQQRRPHLYEIPQACQKTSISLRNHNGGF